MIMILVTGATGFIGSYICRTLLQEQIPFKALKRVNSLVAPDLENGVEWVEGDILDFGSIEEALKNVDTVIHNAALISFYPKEYDAMSEINIVGTSNMINASLEAGVKRFIHMSSIAAIGRVRKSLRINNDSQWLKSTDNSRYGETKYYSELEVWRGLEEGLSTVILNPSVVLGPGDWNFKSTRMFKYVWDQGTFYPSGTFNFVDIRDLVKATIKLANSNVQGERFIVNAGKIDYKSFFEKIAEQFSKKPPSYKLSPWIANIAIPVDRLKSKLLGVPPLITRETLRLSTIDYDYDGFKIKRLLDFDFRRIEDTIAWTCMEVLKNSLKN